ncbi:MAG TPA: hypothetical protein VM492_18920 [Sumerlaeia bacterium]|nr:hypothetical protein [Sumerlaeia bacterium]
MTRAQAARTHVLLGLVAWCLGCVHPELQWDHLGSLRVVEYDPDTEKAFYEGPERDSFASTLMPAGVEPILYADTGKSVYLGLHGEVFGVGRSRRLTGGEWDFCDITRSGLFDLFLGDASARAGPDTHPIILRLLLRAALYQNISESLRVEDLVERIDVACDWEREDLPLEEGEKLWKEMKLEEKKEAVRYLVEGLCVDLTAGPDVWWVKHGDTHYGWLFCSGSEHDFYDSQYWPPSVLQAVNETHDGPQVVYRGTVGGSRVVITQTFTCNYFEERAFRGADFFFHTGEHLLLGLHGAIWMLCSDGEWRKSEPYPVEPHPPARVEPAFFYRNPFLYAFGQSKADPNKAVVLRTDLTELRSR